MGPSLARPELASARTGNPQLTLQSFLNVGVEVPLDRLMAELRIIAPAIGRRMA